MLITCLKDSVWYSVCHPILRRYSHIGRVITQWVQLLQNLVCPKILRLKRRMELPLTSTATPAIGRRMTGRGPLTWSHLPSRRKKKEDRQRNYPITISISNPVRAKDVNRSRKPPPRQPKVPVVEVLTVECLLGRNQARTRVELIVYFTCYSALLP